ncbi:MAG TPA: hypothetical protein VFW07_25045 [Parafilimonas sp.]|nr:hypothetical protein [Parafilimonas sp.]
MNRILLVLLSFIVNQSVSAQFTLTLQIPQAGVLLKPQLWNGVLTNAYPDTRRVYLGVTLSDVSTGEPVLSATTSNIDLLPGSLQLLESNLSPITYNYLSPDINDRDPEGFLPAGSYTACYNVFLVDENSGTPLAEQCTPLVVEPVSPPILNIPMDKQVIHSSFPQFSWIPPMPMEIFSDLNYDFVLVEVQQGQSSADAIQQNLPIYSTNTRDIFLNYPASLPSLDTGKLYGWQITAKNKNTFTANSDIWTFSLFDTSFHQAGEDMSQYTKLLRVLDASISVAINNLLAYYDNNSHDSTVQYNIYDIDKYSQDGNARQLIVSDQLKLLPGVNLISLPLDKISAIGNNKQYLFQILNSRNETWSMKFIFYKKD